MEKDPEPGAENNTYDVYKLCTKFIKKCTNKLLRSSTMVVAIAAGLID